MVVRKNSDEGLNSLTIDHRPSTIADHFLRKSIFDGRWSIVDGRFYAFSTGIWISVT